MSEDFNGAGILASLHRQRLIHMAHSTDLTSGSIWKKLIKYSAPLVASNVLQASYNIVDMIVAGRFIGPSSLSAISNAGVITNMITMIIVGLTTGGNIIIGQCFGAGDKRGCEEGSTTLMSSSMLLGVIIAAITYMVSHPFLSILQAPALDEAVQYLRICSIGIIFIAGYNASAAMLRAVGNSRASLICIIITTVMNIVFDVVFVAVFKWGVAGAAYATIGSQCVSFIVSIVIVLKNNDVFGIRLSRLYIKIKYLKIIVRLGGPCAIQMSVASLSWLSVAYLINSHGLIISAGNGISIKIKELCQLFLSAMSVAASSMIAQNIGAEKYDRVREVVFTAMKIAIIMALILIALIETLAPQFVSLFTSDADTAAAAVYNLRIEIIGQIFYAIILIGHALMTGSGNTWFATSSSFINCILFRLPLAFLLNHFFGISGVYIACMVAPASSIPFVLWYEKSNRWRKSLVAV